MFYLNPLIMKPIYNSYPKPKCRLLHKTCVLFVAAITLTSLFASCTADEIEVQPETETLKEGYFQRKDSIVKDPIPSNTTNIPPGGEIDPPVKFPPPPPNP